MGKVRQEYIKKLARKVVERFPKRFNSDFKQQKNGGYSNRCHLNKS